MLFYNNAHRQFYYDCLHKCSNHDSYHKSLFYTLGIDPDTRIHLHELYDFKEDSINIEGLSQAWQTTGSYKTSLFAFNMWNGYAGADEIYDISPDQLFNCEYARYFQEAIKLRFPYYFKEYQADISK